MNVLYNTGIRLYALAAQAVSLRSPKVRKMLRGQHRTNDILRRRLGLKPGCVWFHASSLGEFEQGRPMIERLRREHPEKPILLSFFSPSGFEVRKNYPYVDAVVYLPFDTPHRVRHFLDLARPSMAIFIKYEFWGNYLGELRRRGIPTYIISAIFRPGQRFFRSVGGMFRKMLRDFNHLYVQDERGADEDVYVPWLNAHSDVAFIIAPHEFNETRLEALRNRFPAGSVILLSEWLRLHKAHPDGDFPPYVRNIRGIIVDSFGKLSTLYRFADIAYIGGGFGAGIHNLNEAAVYDMPVIFGPEHSKFKEASDLIARGGGFSISNASDFNNTMDALTTNPLTLRQAGEAAGKYIKENIGATERIYSDLFG